MPIDATGKEKQLISFPSLLGNQVRSKLHNKKTNIVDITVVRVNTSVLL